MTKEPRIYNGKRTVSSINGVAKTGQPHAKEWNWTPILHHTKELTSKWIKDLNERPETIKLLEENIGDELLDIGLGDEKVLDLKPKAKATKAKIKWDYIKLKSSWYNKGNHQQNEKATYQMGENICKSYIW